MFVWTDNVIIQKLPNFGSLGSYNLNIPLNGLFLCIFKVFRGNYSESIDNCTATLFLLNLIAEF